MDDLVRRVALHYHESHPVLPFRRVVVGIPLQAPRGTPRQPYMMDWVIGKTLVWTKVVRISPTSQVHGVPNLVAVLTSEEGIDLAEPEREYAWSPTERAWRFRAQGEVDRNFLIPHSVYYDIPFGHQSEGSPPLPPALHQEVLDSPHGELSMAVRERLMLCGALMNLLEYGFTNTTELD